MNQLPRPDRVKSLRWSSVHQRWRLRWIENGRERSRTFRDQAAAEAEAEQLRQRLAQGSPGASELPSEPDRGQWLRLLWEQAQAVRGSGGDPAKMADVITRLAKAAVPLLPAGDKSGADDLEQMSEAELAAEERRLRSVG